MLIDRTTKPCVDLFFVSLLPPSLHSSARKIAWELKRLLCWSFPSSWDLLSRWFSLISTHTSVIRAPHLFAVRFQISIAPGNCSECQGLYFAYTNRRTATHCFEHNPLHIDVLKPIRILIFGIIFFFYISQGLTWRFSEKTACKIWIIFRPASFFFFCFSLRSLCIVVPLVAA